MRQPVETTNHQAEGSQTVDSATENVQTRPVNSSLTDTGEFQPDSISSGEPSIFSSQEDYDISAIDTGLDFYDKELVDAPNTEERQDQTEPGGPDVSAEMQASLPHDNTWNDLQYATHNHTPGQFEGKPKQACLHAETSRPTPPGVSFDIDSILGFVTSPATAIHGIRFYSAPHYVQNTSTDVHLTLDRLDPDPERPRLIPLRLKDVPHFIFARAEGADFITFHLFFPHLPCSRDFNRLTDEQLSRWFDDIFYRHLGQLYDGNIPKSSQTFYLKSMLRDAGGITTLTPVRSRLRRGGILYSQMYSLTKEILDAARTYPFQNPDLRLLALDPQLRNGMQSIVGKPASGKNVTDQAVREEYRISWTLFQSVLAVLRSVTPEARSTQLPGPPSYLWAVRTPIFVDYVWHNINKFTTGFKLIRAQRSGGLTTWEQTKMMDMFLRCLRVAVGGHDYSRCGGADESCRSQRAYHEYTTALVLVTH
ncbi:hypothetical protein FPHYL_12737 [Fusarium phyllophilum]|uniref:Uncharacterized protein n=1 Tax=Fusarium phyllophilum TaxID=47803 RepID=A0A8H5IIK6_9HYPO|nr:hypothetical protein FPHYL_12737 [Fusarium phyllophilum]